MKTIENVHLNTAKNSGGTGRSQVPGPDRRVLRLWVVDNDAALRGLFAELLTRQPGLRCTRQFPSAEALLATLAEERPPDMILLDINLGGQSGLSAIGPIRKLAPSVKVLMLTMFSNNLYELEAFQSGASGFLLKSYELDEIVKLIHEAHHTPRSPALFPNIRLDQKAEWDSLATNAARAPGKRFSLVRALRQLYSSPRRQTAS
jgi:DNA-binding NarL/FixJ family response regulator